jgi:hypothetical protein
VWKRKKIFAVDLFVVLWILIFEKKRSREECLVKIPTLIEERTLNPKKNKKKTEVRSLNLLSDIFPPQTCDQI